MATSVRRPVEGKVLIVELFKYIVWYLRTNWRNMLLKRIRIL